MEHINLAYSLKNIPIPTHSTYKLLLTEKIESLIKRMRWKAHFYLKGINNQDNTNIFNLKSKKCSPICKHMQAFEKYLTNMVKICCILICRCMQNHKVDTIKTTSDTVFQKNIPLTLLKGLCVRGSWRPNRTATY